MIHGRAGSWIDTALSYAQFGWKIVPHHGRVEGTCTCGNPKCKRPPHPWERAADEKLATSHPQTIRGWADVAPAGHVGLLVGKPSDVIVFEVSRREGGIEALATLEEDHSPLPDVPVIVVDAHRYLRLFSHPGVPLPESKRIGAGLRLLGDGHVLLLPDQTTTAGRSFRRWLIPPTRNEMVQLPQWLRSKAVAGQSSRARSTPPHTDDASRDGDSRNPEAHRTPRAPSSPASSGSRTHVRDDGKTPSPRDDLFSPLEDPESLPFRTYTELDLYKLADPVWRIKPWIADDCLTVIAGPAKTAGKTTLLLHMVKCLLGGEVFLSEPCTPTDVAYVTEQSARSFSRALIEAGVRDDEALQHLHVLYRGQLEGSPWPEIVQGCSDFCINQSADLLIVDSLVPFAKESSVSESLKCPSFVDPLLYAIDRGIATCLVLSTTQGATVEDALDQLGYLQPHVDTLVHLRPTDERAARLRLLSAVSRFKVVPSRLTIQLGDRGYSVHQSMHAVGNEPWQPSPLARA